MENKRVYCLKKSSDFLHLSKNGKKIRLANWLLLLYSDNNAPKLLLGITASRKVGSAVVRNKLKRWVRMCARETQFKNKFEGKKVSLIFKPQSKEFYKEIKYKEFYEKFQKSWLNE